MPASFAPPNSELLSLSQERARILLQEDPRLQKSITIPALVAEVVNKSKVSIDFVMQACRVYAERPALGHRLPREKTFRTVSYSELWEQVSGLASGWAHSGLVRPGDTVGILGFGSPEFVVAELACLYLGAVSAPLQVHMPTSDFEHIVHEAEIACLVCSSEHVDDALKILPRCPSVKSLVLIDIAMSDKGHNDISAYQHELNAAGVPTRLATIADVIALGTAEGVVRSFRPAPDSDPIVTLMYTSGSTGRPKGAVFHERLWAQYWRGSQRLDQGPNLPLVYLSFSPLNHIAGRISVLRSIVNGGLIHFTQKSDMSTLFDDIRTARPTTFFLVPRVSALIYQEFQREVMNLRSQGNDDIPPEQLAERVMESMRRQFLGDRLLSVLTGSAPTSSEIMSFLKRTFEVPIFNAYGSTEGGIISVDDRILRPQVEDYKIVDAPDLDYHRTDKPYPRGELHVKLRQHVRYYLKNAAASSELFDQDGYLRTGDIVEERGPDHLVWIDRKKNVLKLSQGEFVSLWRLESIYAGGSGVIDQIFLYGSGTRSYLVAVIVPRRDVLANLVTDLSDEAAIKRVIQSDINKIARDQSLFPYEIPRDLIIEWSRFSKEQGLLTESGKQIAGRLRARYGETLEQLYQLHDNQQLLELAKLRALSSELGVAAKVTRAISATLGIPEADLDLSHTFTNLGGDSMNAVELSSTLDQLSNIKIPVGSILNPSMSIRQLSELAESLAQQDHVARAGDFAAVHGDAPTQVLAADLDIERYFSAQELSEIDSMPALKKLDGKTVLLTGANGFLGRFLAVELLARSSGNGTVYCVVRAPNDEVATERFIQSFKEADESLLDMIATVIEDGRLIPIAGDLMQPHLGLTLERWQELCLRVDKVLHNGALVNHAFTYEQLYEPNVLGTVEMIRFALSGRRKTITFVSSVGVASYLPRNTRVTEDETAGQLFSGVPLLDGYAAGYGTTKWAAELLLEKAAARFNLPVTTVRCGMILAHQSETGQINSADFFSRLLCGLVYTRISPTSFYTADSVAIAHFDGLPVDYVAQSIAAVCLEPSTGYTLYHCVNDQDATPVSLDDIVHWVKSAGYNIESLAKYDEWYLRFSDRLQNLPPHKRQHSPLPIIYQWEHPINANHEARFAATKLQSRRTELGLNGVPPLINEAFIHRCLHNLQALDLIKAPEQG